MHWQRVEPTQRVAALIVIGASPVARLAETMRGKSSLLQLLPVAHGEGWAAIFAASLPDGAEDVVLPRIDAALPLYETASDIWLPIGVAPAVPDHVAPPLLRAMFALHGVAPPAIIVPRLPAAADRTAEADIYVVGTPVAFRDSYLAACATTDG